ncbi:MAG: hypothetical protein C4346_09485 [Chloroflexota bacterium]
MSSKSRRPVFGVRSLAIAIVLALIGSVALPLTMSGTVMRAKPVLAQADRSGLYVNKWDCPTSFGGDFGLLLANCSITSNVTFQVTGLGFYGPTTFQGGFSLSGMPAGNYRISETIPQGYGEPVVFCGFAAYNEQQPVQSRVVTYDGVYEFQLAQDQAIY